MNVIIYTFATLFDFTTIITVVCSYRTNRFYKVLLWALFASLCGEIVLTVINPIYSPSVISIYKLVGQILVGSAIYFIKKGFRKRGRNMQDKKVNEDIDINEDIDVNRVFEEADNSEFENGQEEEVIKPKRPPNKSVDNFFKDMARMLSLKLAWRDRTTLEKSYTAMFLIMIVGLFPMPYDFYYSLRVIVCICLFFYFQIILPQRDVYKKWFFVMIGLFVLYNPIIPIRFGEQSVWAVVNLLTIIILYKARIVFDVTKDNADE